MSSRGKLKYILLYILLAILIEVIALAAYFPAFIERMMRHSAGAPRSHLENVSNVVAFILHLPTILLTYPFGEITLVLVTPITQIVFWSSLFAYVGRRRGVR